MAAQMNPKGQPVPTIQRAHRPRPADTMTPIRADAYYPETEELPARPSWFRQHSVVIGIGMLFMLALWVLGTTYVVPFIEDKIDHWNTGDARISHYDLDVGHGGTSHFVTQFWYDQVILIEFPGGNAAKAKVYVAPVQTIGMSQTKRVVSLTIGKFNPHGTKPDIAASVTGFAAPVIFYNTGSGFSTEAP